jgi:NADPH:quinone reductase-like Zn-dependent oxidoreductase
VGRCISVLLEGLAGGGIAQIEVSICEWARQLEQSADFRWTRRIVWQQRAGADKVIDYRHEDFTKTGETLDIIVDAVGKSSFSQCQGSLNPRGVCFATAPTPVFFINHYGPD